MSVAVLDIENYPPNLRAWTNGSEALWLLGNQDLLSLPLAAVVGAREVSPEGIARAKRITALLVREGFCVVSGLAHGVDTAAHQTALGLGGLTIAVMGTPIEQCYPRENQELKKEIAEKGLVVSQFPPGSSVQRGNFPRRNVLMATMSSITFVIEAEITSGTRHQVKAAIQMGRHVAFLASLAERNYPWVLDALKSGFGTVIQRPDDAVALLRELKLSQEEVRAAIEPDPNTGSAYSFQESTNSSVSSDDTPSTSQLSSPTPLTKHPEFDFAASTPGEPPAPIVSDGGQQASLSTPKYQEPLEKNVSFWRQLYQKYQKIRRSIFG